MSENGKRELPAGWRWVKLNQVALIVNGTTPTSNNPSYWNGEITWVTPMDLGRLTSPNIYTSERKITTEGLKSCNLTLVPPGTVVLSSRAPIGYLGITTVELCTNQGCKSFVPKDYIDSEFLYFALKNSVSEIQKLGSGATFAEVSKTQLEEFQIPLPPIKVQRYIAGLLKRQMGGVDKARAAAEERLAAVRALPAAYLREVFGSDPVISASPTTTSLTARSGWKWYRLTELARLATGHTPSRYHPEYWGGDVPWLQLADIRDLDGRVAFNTSEYTNELGLRNSSSVLLPKDTVCLSRTASVGFVTIMGRPMATSQDFVNWVCKSGLDPKFLLYLLLASRKRIRDLGSGAVHKTIYFPTVQAFNVCIPPIAEQHRYARLLDEQLSGVEKVRIGAEAELNSINELPASLLRRAFNGEM